MVGLLLLKQIENLCDKCVEAWVRNPYYQAFCGMQHFQWKFPCNPSEFVHFRKRIGISGVEKIVSVGLHGEKAREKEIVIDSTVQEKNITFPTDTNLRVKVIERCRKLAKAEEIKLRRSYCKEMKRLQRTIRFGRTAKTQKKVGPAIRRVKTIANILFRELRRKLSEERLEQLTQHIELYEKAVNQGRKNKDKVYRLHEPAVYCVSKGKEHKKFEFGSKVSFAMSKTTGILVAAMNFSKNEYDGHTLEAALTQAKEVRGREARVVYCDRGYRGIQEVGMSRSSRKNLSSICIVTDCWNRSCLKLVGGLKLPGSVGRREKWTFHGCMNG